MASTPQITGQAVRTSNRMIRCNEKIALSKYSDTYCQKALGHDGEHSINAQPEDIRCPAYNEGVRCSQPAGHFGAHHVVDGAVSRAW